MIEQGGRNLSGGQKQRLTIARAVVKDPDILILDDSASALDFATDAKLRSALRNLQGNKTIFIVSQRTSSIQFADQIIVMDDGHAVGIGTHEQLLENCEIIVKFMNLSLKKKIYRNRKEVLSNGSNQERKTTGTDGNIEKGVSLYEALHPDFDFIDYSGYHYRSTDFVFSNPYRKSN